MGVDPMRLFRISMVCMISMCGICSIGTATADAKPKVLFLEAGEPGEGVNVTDPWLFVQGTVALELSGGRTIECHSVSGNEFEGAVVTTDAKTDAIEVTQTYQDLRGRVSKPCEESLELGLIHATYVGVSGFPWTVDLHANGTAAVTGKAVVKVTYLSMLPDEPDSESTEVCEYQLARLHAVEVIEGPLSVTFSGTLKRTATSPKACAKSLRYVERGPTFASDSIRGLHQGEIFYEVDAWVR